MVQTSLVMKHTLLFAILLPHALSGSAGKDEGLTTGVLSCDPM